MTDNKRELGQALDQYRTAAKFVLNRRNSDKTAADWVMYTAAAASAMSLAGNAEAAIVYSGVQDLSVTRPPAPFWFLYTPVDIDADGRHDIEVGLFLGIGTGLGEDSAAAAGYWGPQFIGTGIFASKLSSGATIGSAGPFVSGSLASFRITDGPLAFGNWGPNDIGFAGIQFQRGADTHYAWLRLALSSDEIGPSELTVVDWAWENQPGKDIAAGVVPLPGSLGFLAAGAAGLALFRRRRKPV